MELDGIHLFWASSTLFYRFVHSYLCIYIKIPDASFATTNFKIVYPNYLIFDNWNLSQEMVEEKNIHKKKKNAAIKI